jgi:hypothetical protein
MNDKKKKLLEQLEALRIFPKTKLVKELQKQIQSKLEKFEQKEVKVKKKKEPNISRASKLRKYHHYLRLIRDNFPDLKYNEIRSQFSRRKKGHDVSIPDAIWKNPSP